MTAQTSENIIIGEKKLALLTEPLALLLEERGVKFTARSSSCWRRYIGTWELKDDGLYLIAFNGWQGDDVIELKDLSYRESSSPVKATWFSGKLRIPIGQMAQYIHGGFESSYTEELKIEIDKGDAIGFIYEVFHLKKVKVNTSMPWIWDKPTYEYKYQVDSKETFNISKYEMIDIINKKNQLPKHYLGGSYNFSKMNDFINEYKKQLEDVQYILQYLKTYPTILSDLRIEDIIEPDNLYQQQEDWIRLNSKFNGIEKEFFKPYWLPIQRVGFDYFIDISDSNYPIIEAFFNYFDEPYYWEKKILFHSINKLMLADDNKLDLKQYKLYTIVNKYYKYL